MADHYLPSGKLFGMDCSIDARRNEPRGEAHGDARIGGDQGTPTRGNVDAPAVAQQDVTACIAAMRCVGITSPPVWERSGRDFARDYGPDATYVAPAVAQQNETLTSAEMRVLSLLAGGECDKRIAKSLGIAPSTINTHLRSIYKKFGTRSRISTVVRALRIGLLRLEDIAC